MKRSGDDVRLAGLKNKKRPDLKERQVLERLEAKYLGLVFVAEVKRKEKEKADKLQKMQERAKAIEAQDRENRLGGQTQTAEAAAGHGCLCRVGETAS